MTRILVFCVSVAATVGAIGTLDWWVDPFADRYDGAVLSAALNRRDQCFVSHTVIGERTWPEFKVDLARHRGHRTIIAGTSRVWKLGAHPREQGFANLSLPGMGLPAVQPLFERLQELDRGPTTIYLGVEILWFSEHHRGPKMFAHSIRDDARYLLSAETLSATLDVLRQAPGAIRHPKKLRPWQITDSPRGCLIDREGSVLRGAANAWAPDGRWYWRWEITGQARSPGPPFVVKNHTDFIGNSLAAEKVRMLEDALELAQGAGWKVIGFAPPFSTDSIARLRTDPKTRGLFEDFRARMPGIFQRHGFPFVDLTDVAKIPCSQHSFDWDDGAHTDEACARRVRAHVDEAAA